MQAFDRMNVQAELPAIKLRLALLEFIGLVADNDDGIPAICAQQSLIKNIVGDIIGKNAQSKSQILRGVFDTQVSLEAELGFEAAVPDL